MHVAFAVGIAFAAVAKLPQSGIHPRIHQDYCANFHLFVLKIIFIIFLAIYPICRSLKLLVRMPILQRVPQSQEQRDLPGTLLLRSSLSNGGSWRCRCSMLTYRSFSLPSHGQRSSWHLVDFSIMPQIRSTVASCRRRKKKLLLGACPFACIDEASSSSNSSCLI